MKSTLFNVSVFMYSTNEMIKLQRHDWTGKRYLSG